MNKPTKKIPISTAKAIAKEYNKDQVIIIAWNKEYDITFVTTYGKTKKDCEEAAIGGNVIKRKVLGWPKEECDAKPSHIRRKQINE